MPKKDGDDYVISETGNWNVADDYSKQMIMKSLVKASYLEDVAYFGYESLSEELLSYNLPPNDIVKYKALDRLIKELIKLINNTKFALKKEKTKEEVLQYKRKLQSLHKTLPKLIRVTTNQIQRSSSFKINDIALFNSYVDLVSEIRSKINEPLNKNHLIFTDKEEFDPKKFKDNLKRRMIEEG